MNKPFPAYLKYNLHASKQSKTCFRKIILYLCTKIAFLFLGKDVYY